MNKKVLIVEDDDDLRRGLRLRVAKLGYDVVEAADGCAAIELAGIELPDVVLLDLGLPGIDGLAVLEQYETMPQLAAIPVVVLTGRDPFATEPATRAHNVSGFLRKPADNAELAAAIQRALGPDDRQPTSVGSASDRS